MPLSEDAIKHCTSWIQEHCKFTISEAAIKPIIDTMRPRFQSRLDTDAGARTWEGDKPAMEDNCRYMGVFTEFFAKDETDVTTEHLKAALYLVAAKCDVGRGDDKLHSFWVYCSDGMNNSLSKDCPDAVRVVQAACGKEKKKKE